MSYSVETIENFEREARRLKKKYKSLKAEISQLVDDLEKNPFQGVAMRDGFYKAWVSVQKGRANEVERA